MRARWHISFGPLTHEIDFPFAQIRHRATTVGLLLGLAAGRLGSCDSATTRDLGLHLPALLPPHSSLEFSAPLSVQTAALLGLGLLYQGTGHRLRVEFLLAEIGRTARHGVSGVTTVQCIGTAYRCMVTGPLCFVNCTECPSGG